MSKNFSYKLDIDISPYWYKIMNKIGNFSGPEEQQKFIDEYIDNNRSSGLWNTSYRFTEYYDSVSGLTTKFQMVMFENNKQIFRTVDDFDYYGYLSDGLRDGKSYQENREDRDKFTVIVGEDYIANNIFDPNIGGLKGWPEKEDVIWSFPLDIIFEFLLTLGLSFPTFNGGSRAVLKWPDSIEKELEKRGIKYQAPYFGYTPETLGVEKDKAFFKQYGEVQITQFSNEERGSFDSEYATCHVSLTVFQPGENNRIGF